jgi:hypothetical protein
MVIFAVRLGCGLKIQAAKSRLPDPRSARRTLGRGGERSRVSPRL